MMAGKIFVVTGGNRGIGLGIVRSLAKKVNDGIIYLTVRRPDSAEEALKNINKRNSEILVHQLDITEEGSCRVFADHLKTKHGGFDVLINNAGVAFSRTSIESPEVQADVTIGVNYYGTKLVSGALQPLIRGGGRVINICSSLGKMSGFYSDEWIKYFQDQNLTEEDIDHFVETYKQAARDNDRKEKGFPESAYRVSKTAEIAYTLLQSRFLKPKNIIVNGCCPGYVSTDMTNHQGHLTVEEGVDTPVYLAIDPTIPSGEFVYLRKVEKYNE